MTKVDKINEVRILRYQKGLTIREIEKRVRLSHTTIQKILNSGQTQLTYHRRHSPQPATGNVRDIITKWLREDLNVKKKLRRKTVG